MAKGSGESRTDLTLRQGNRSEIRNNSSGIPEGEWIGRDGVSHTESLHNCWTDASWFFPVFSSLTQTANPNFVFIYVGQEQHGGVNAQHVRASQLLSQDLPLSQLTSI